MTVYRGVARIFQRGVTLCQSEGTHQARVVQKADNAIYWTNHYPVDRVVCLRFVNAYPLDNNLSAA